MSDDRNPSSEPRGSRERASPGHDDAPARHGFADAGGARLADWHVHPRVRARITTRIGGVSRGAWAADPAAPALGGGLNLGASCGDDPEAVRENRRRLARELPDAPLWLAQVHGTQVWRDDGVRSARDDEGDAALPRADAAITDRSGRVLAVLTADCLPVLLAERDARVVGIAHAGWRGLAHGVVEAAVAAMRERVPDAQIAAFLGPAIGPRAFEVGDEVREAFCDADPRAREAFVPGVASGKWFADLYALARQRLAGCGVTEVAGAPACTVSDASRFYSFRRDRTTGRMASLIWIDAAH